jgi:hypothetical protein
MRMNWLAYEHYFYAALAVLGTVAAVWLVQLLAHHGRLAVRLKRFRGVAPPFLNVNAMLFGLTLAFIANDTWSARDRAMDAVLREADNLRSLLVLAEVLPPAEQDALTASVRAYGAQAAAEFDALRARRVAPGASEAADAMLRLVAAPGLAQAAGEVVQTEMLRKVMVLRDDRDLRVSLSRTHLNPLKWLGMAALGFLTIVSIAAVHLGAMRAGMLAIALFALAAAPSAAIVLVQGNPFQQPAAISAEPIVEAVR